MITEKVKVINVGLEFFCEELKKQSVPVVQVSWNPPAQGNTEVFNLLKSLYSSQVGEN